MRYSIAITILLSAGGLELTRARGAQPAAEEDSTVKAWAEFATPNENHKRLGDFVGSWNIHMKFWPRPTAAPQESDGAAEIHWILGNRYIEQRQNCPMMGQPMSGIGYTGFDNIKRKYVTVWLDNIGTSILKTWGTFDSTKQSIKTQGTIDDPLTHKPLRYEDTATMINPDRFIYTAWTSTPDSAKMSRVMEIVYTRR